MTDPEISSLQRIPRTFRTRTVRRRNRTATLAVLGLFAVGCQTIRPPQPTSERADLPVTEFRVEDARLMGAVDLHLEIPREPTGPKPAIIHLIGDTKPFVDAGFVVVTFKVDWRSLDDSPAEPPTTGNTVGKWVLASPSAAVLGETYLRTIATTGERIVPAIIDWLETFPEVDARRIGMSGGSTNGFITLQAVAAERRIRSAVVIAACGDYHGFLRDSSMGMQGAPLELDPSYDRWIEEHEVIRHPRRLVPTPILMVNRTGDELIPVSCADATANVLEATYERAGAPERFRYVRFEATGHGIGPDERREANAWLWRWLVTDAM